MTKKPIRYYSTQRPIGPGTIPNDPKPAEIVNFDSRQQVESIGRPAWGYVDYEDPLDDKTASDYELVREKDRYSVRFWVTGSFTAEVIASSIEEAKEEATHLFEEADFGDLNDADGGITVIEDSDGRQIG